MNEERNMLIFTNDEGDEIKLELLDYFLYEEEEYALLVAADEQDDEDECDQDSCGNSECGCHGEEREIIVMKVLVDGDVEEFLPVDEDKLDGIAEFLQESLDDEAGYDENEE